ncbi:BTB/POZ and MATH domain-containing protein 2-like isoform X2 [Phragmites australis]|uniref:BTB/POZ and MATH domain-containing protein 2-like isoform X2 n=1 Tax=Phragmites australis TaxID=29695 RepID=UPI002D7951F8|nr:BTB/POZ and MATH domain-containing protein 2-like isoform X2 [Phragmites australis]
MASTAAGGKLERSASAIIADATSGHHILKIDGYSRTKGTPTGEFIKSHPFTMGDHCWCIQYYPSGKDSESADYISLFVFLNESVTKAVKAQFKLRFVDEAEEQTLSLTSEEIRNFESYRGWGQPRFIEREALERSKHLKDDSFMVRCDVIIINEIRTEEISMAEAATIPAFVSVPPSDLHQHLGDLLQTEKGADVVFEVGGETFAAHRCVLGARSPVFSAELYGAMKESHAAGAVRIDDMEAHVFKALLCFIYTDSLPEMNKADEAAMSQHLLVAADRYNLERLKLICEHKLCKCIEASTLSTILALAEQHHCHGLKKACFNFLSSPENLTAVLASDGIEYLNRSCPSVIKELIAKLGQQLREETHKWMIFVVGTRFLRT